MAYYGAAEAYYQGTEGLWHTILTICSILLLPWRKSEGSAERYQAVVMGTRIAMIDGVQHAV